MKIIGAILASHAATGKQLTVRRISVDRNEANEVEQVPI
jgi:hypothetical protein